MAQQSQSFLEVTSHPETSATGSNGGSDGNLLPITGHKLNGQNYLQWSQSGVAGKRQLPHRSSSPTKQRRSKVQNMEVREQHGDVLAYQLNDKRNRRKFPIVCDRKGHLGRSQINVF